MRYIVEVWDPNQRPDPNAYSTGYKHVMGNRGAWRLLVETVDPDLANERLMHTSELGHDVRLTMTRTERPQR